MATSIIVSRDVATLLTATIIIVAIPVMTPIDAMAEVQETNIDYNQSLISVVLDAEGRTSVIYSAAINGSKAEEIPILLPGENIHIFSVISHDNEQVQYKRGKTEINSLELVLPPVKSGGVDIFYQASGLVTRSENNWTFSLDSPTRLTVTLPKGSAVESHLGDSPVIELHENQTVFTYKQARHVEFTYSLGAGTMQQPPEQIEKQVTGPISFFVIVILIAIAAAAIAALMKWKEKGKLARRHPADRAAVNEGEQEEEMKPANHIGLAPGSETNAAEPRVKKNDNVEKLGSQPISPSQSPSSAQPPPTRKTEPVVKEDIINRNLDHSIADSSSLRRPPVSIAPSESQLDKTVLLAIVCKILAEKTDLHPEDRQVLEFLAEKEGSAFEGEIRDRFTLPKTTLWRLVRRLEREELVEIRKAGGQNLIKLRFEDKQL